MKLHASPSHELALTQYPFATRAPILPCLHRKKPLLDLADKKTDQGKTRGKKKAALIMGKQRERDRDRESVKG